MVQVLVQPARRDAWRTHDIHAYRGAFAQGTCARDGFSRPMILSDSHVKTLVKEGAARAGAPPSGAEWRVSPEAVAAAKLLAEEEIRRLGEDAARRGAVAGRSTLRAEDFGGA